MREIITLLEEKSRPQDIGIVELSYTDSDLNPVMSARTMEYHYGKLAHGYADRFNKDEGDREFNYAGAFLHNLFFPQFRKSRNNNRPNGPIGSMINAKFGSWEEFKQQFQKQAMTVQGSGWVYLARSGEIKIIPNHQVRDDILILVDWWEHAWALDYQSDKKQYLANIWKIFDWNVINARWGQAYRND